MPGIVGLITRMPRLRAEAELRRMLAGIHHEPFYRTGTWSEESLGVYVGWTELIGSFSDGMPLYNEKKDVCLVFSGDEYPDPQTVQQLRSKGHSVGASEADYLVHLYEENPDFVQDLN